MNYKSDAVILTAVEAERAAVMKAVSDHERNCGGRKQGSRALEKHLKF
ncbi:MAG: hypothetical protein IJ711_05245 [Lachnospiraceae bacterium]|nr:hypothetical protein [Lachnospiraceae bacterium]